MKLIGLKTEDQNGGICAPRNGEKGQARQILGQQKNRGIGMEGEHRSRVRSQSGESGEKIRHLVMTSDSESNLGWRVIKPAFWTAPAKRSGDGAFFEVIRVSREAELKQSGVARRFPPTPKCRLHRAT
jgi:hypothetical protein